MATWINTVVSPHFVMMAILAIAVVGGVYAIWRTHRSTKNSFDLTDLITTDGANLSEHKLARLGAWAVSTWGFVYLIIDGKLTEWYFVGYMGTWVANALISKSIDAKSKVVESSE